MWIDGDQIREYLKAVTAEKENAGRLQNYRPVAYSIENH
jgi:hypothetical protein